MNIRFNKKAWSIFLCLLLFVCGYAQTNKPFNELYFKECSNTKRFFKENKSLFDKAAASSGLSTKFLFSIVAPEITQYSYLSNKLETYSLVVFYVQGGSAYANFSIGYFQMKPSFVEKMEAFALGNKKLVEKYKDYLFQNPDTRASRVERIEKLKSIEGQINYLSLFCDIIQIRFGNLSFSNDEEKLRFYAAAYNVGFDKPAETITEIGKKSLFPHFTKQKFRYVDVSSWFFKESK